ncbi:MAG: hypothetical protein F6K54_25530 [Okeania sp. SIO3B5]|uniref:hypothetical protein n=1 Tax=Okeania sp. SIO3B5 TaxID=2607811 RepID=UPI001400256F|nr:hypothetical protein [Okeania sp. SIO3B5]NEO56140.1 hypothetical protein [Okeania sp. SIO3B5]
MSRLKLNQLIKWNFPFNFVSGPISHISLSALSIILSKCWQKTRALRPVGASYGNANQFCDFTQNMLECKPRISKQ